MLNGRTSPLLLALAFLFSASILRADDFVVRTYTDPQGKAHAYRLLMPAPYDPAQKYPVILFFHGAGQRGDDNLAEIHNAGMFASPANRAKFPCFVIALQVPHGQQWVNMKWSDKDGIRPAEQSDIMKLDFKILDGVTAEFSTDPSRIYLMGLSMGGYAVWDCITRFPARFAAGVAVCGGGDESTVTPEVAKVPVWAFHSSDDPTVPVVRSRHMIEAMTKAGGHPHYTEYQGLGHGSWGKAFAEPELFPWLFAQRLGQPDTTSVSTPPPPSDAVTP
jgi:predicted peptidase